MKLVGKKRLSGVLEIAMWPLMALNVAVLAFLPWLVDGLMMPFNNNPDFWRPRYLVVLAVSGVVALVMLWQLRKLLHNVNVGTVFSTPTVRLLRWLGFEMLGLAAFYLGTLIFADMIKFSIGLLILTFLMAGLFLLIFAELFKQAAAYKQENDMTI